MFLAPCGSYSYMLSLGATQVLSCCSSNPLICLVGFFNCLWYGMCGVYKPSTRRNIIIVPGEVWKAAIFGLVNITSMISYTYVTMKWLKVLVVGLKQNEKKLVYMSKRCINGRNQYTGLSTDLDTIVSKYSIFIKIFWDFFIFWWDWDTVLV